MEKALFGAGCFWGVEDFFRQVPGVADAVSGYAGGAVANPTYKQVCSDTTGHAEVVEVTFDPAHIAYQTLVELFFKMHNPTTRNRQGPDVGTQYRSVIFTSNDEQRRIAEASRDAFEQNLAKAGYGHVTTAIVPLGEFYFADEYHQQYLAKVPNGYCPNHSTGVKLPADFVVTPLQYVD